MKNKICISMFICLIAFTLTACKPSVPLPDSDFVYSDITYTTCGMQFTLPASEQWQQLTAEQLNKSVGKGASDYFGLFARSNALMQLFTVATIDTVQEGGEEYTAKTFANAQRETFLQQYENTSAVKTATIDALEFSYFISTNQQEEIALYEIYLVHQKDKQLVVIDYTYCEETEENIIKKLQTIIKKA